MQYIEFCEAVNIGRKNQMNNFDIFLVFTQNIDISTINVFSTHSLCFGSKLRKICLLLFTLVLLYKSGA